MNSSRKGAVVFSYINNILTIVINIFWSPYLIHTLGDAEYGIYQMASSFAGYLVLMNLGTGTVITRYVSLYRARKEEEKQENFIAMAWIVCGVLSCLILTVGLLLLGQLGKIYVMLDSYQLAHAKIIYLIVLSNIICTLLTQAFDGIILAYENYMFSQIWTFAKSLLRVILVLALINWRPDSAFISIVDLTLSCHYLLISAGYVFIKLKVKCKLRRWDFPLFRETAIFSLAILLQSFVNQVNSSVDKTLLGAMVSPESVSIYTLAINISTIFSSLSTAMLGIYLPRFTQIAATSDNRIDITKAAVQPSRVQFFVSTTVLLAFLLCGKDFVILWVGKEYLQVWTIAVILMVPMYFLYLTGIIVSVLDALGKRLFRSIVLSLAAVGNILISIMLIQKYGALGAPIGTAIVTILFSVLLMNWYFQFKLDLHIDYLLKEMCRGLWKGELIALIVTMPFAIAIPSSKGGFFIKGAIFVAVLLVVELKCGFNSEELSMIRTAVSKFRGVK